MNSAEESILAWAPRITGSISIGCTLIILSEIRKDKKSERLPITPVTRAVLGMSIFVLLVGLGWFLSTWAVPNSVSCRMQGFILQMALGPPLYNAAILLYANLMIVHGWKVQEIVAIERVVHGAIWSWCLFIATMLLVKDKYHSIGPVCWASDPPPCYDSSVSIPQLEEDGIHCNVKFYSAIFYCFPLWIGMAYTFYGCVRVLIHVRRWIPKSLSTAAAIEQRARTLTLLYSAAILITYVPCIVWSATFWFDYSSFWLNLLYVLLEPLQGVWNLAIFLMNRRQETREWVWRVLVRIFAFGCHSSQSIQTSPSTDNEEQETPVESDQKGSSWTSADGRSCEANV